MIIGKGVSVSIEKLGRKSCAKRVVISRGVRESSVAIVCNSGSEKVKEQKQRIDFSGTVNREKAVGSRNLCYHVIAVDKVKGQGRNKDWSNDGVIITMISCLNTSRGERGKRGKRGRGKEGKRTNI